MRRVKTYLTRRRDYLLLKWAEVKVGLKLLLEKFKFTLKDPSTVNYDKLSDLEKSHLDMDETHAFMDSWPKAPVERRLQFKAFNAAGTGTAADKEGAEYSIDQDTVSSEPLWALWPGQWFKAWIIGARVTEITSKELVSAVKEPAFSHWDAAALVGAARRRLLNGMPESTVRLVYGSDAVDQALKELK